MRESEMSRDEKALSKEKIMTLATEIQVHIVRAALNREEVGILVDLLSMAFTQGRLHVEGGEQ